jgi:hypothetical protein
VAIDCSPPANASASAAAAQLLPFSFVPIRHRAAMRCRAGLGHWPTVFPSQTLRFIPVGSVALVPLRTPVRYGPFASSEPLLRQGLRSVNGQYPAALARQDVTGVTRKAPPLHVASPCFLLPRFMSILIVSKPLWPNVAAHGPLPHRNFSDSAGTARGQRSRAAVR